MGPTRKQDPAREHEDVVLLEDLAPLRDVRGGTGKLRFGQSLAADGARLTNDENAALRTREATPPRRRR